MGMLRFVSGMNGIGALNFDTTGLANLVSSITKLDCDFKENKLILDHLKLQSFAFLDQIDRLGSIQI